MASDFASRLVWWRKRRALSQLALAMRAGTSQRHLSFLELARASPSRDMVLRLAAALDVPLRQQNALLLAAGFAPEWRESDLTAPVLAQVNVALDHMLAQHEPYPAFVVDHHWNLLRANQGAGRLVEFLLGRLPPGTAVNLADALLAPDVLRPYLVNWTEVARYFLRSVEADAAADGNDALLNRLLDYPDTRATLQAPPDAADAPVVPMHFRKGDVSVRLFTTIATLGTPRDITAQELRIECCFPADEPSATVMHGWI